MTHAKFWSLMPSGSIQGQCHCHTFTIRGVRNPMKISDIGLLKNEPTDLKIQKPKTRFPWFGFQKTDIGGLGTVFHVVSFTIHLAA